MDLLMNIMLYGVMYPLVITLALIAVSTPIFAVVCIVLGMKKEIENQDE